MASPAAPTVIAYAMMYGRRVTDFSWVSVTRRPAVPVSASALQRRYPVKPGPCAKASQQSGEPNPAVPAVKLPGP